MSFVRSFRVVIIAALAALLAVSAGCSPGGSTVGKPSKARATTTTLAPPLAPLTGLPDSSGKVTNRPALSVKIENSPAARPQAGLERADVVFEEVVEHGITRFLVVFHSKDGGTVGPVRSIRPMDPPLATPLKGLFAYSGGIPQFVSLLHRAPVQDVGWDAVPGAYHRVKSRKAPSNLFAVTSKLWAAADAEHSEPPSALFTYLAKGVGFVGEQVGKIEIPYSGASKAGYTYNDDAGVWERTQNGTPHVAESGQQIRPVNLIVQLVQQRTLNYRDVAGTRIPETIVTGSGEALVLSKGKLVRGRWERPTAGVPTRYLDATGAVIALTSGSTWVHLAPVGTAVAVSSPISTTTISGRSTTSRK